MRKNWIQWSKCVKVTHFDSWTIGIEDHIQKELNQHANSRDVLCIYSNQQCNKTFLISFCLHLYFLSLC